MRFAVLCAVWAWVLLASGAIASADDHPFTRESLLRRFDKTSDGKLSLAERKTLRAAFGDIDVPMLPASPLKYTEVELPGYVDRSQWLQMDDTPADNEVTDAGAALGRVLFYDRQLSANNTVACASCHRQDRAFADPRRRSVGFQGGQTPRNSMGLINLRYSRLNGLRPGFFWDERAATLEDQALMPIQDELEMGMPLDKLEAKLSGLPYYGPLFKAAFGSEKIDSHRVAMALAQFLRAMVSFNAKFDRAAEAAGGDWSKDFDQFTAEENLGKSLFFDGVGRVGEFGCAHCHVPPTFSMPKSMNNGLDRHYPDRGLGGRDAPNNDPFTPSNDGKFKAPSLRNVALTAPYMHDGRFATLAEVVDHYSAGVHPHPNLALAFPDEAPAGENGTSGFGLSAREKSALVAFLETLTDEKIGADARFSDPFVRLNE